MLDHRRSSSPSPSVRTDRSTVTTASSREPSSIHSRAASSEATVPKHTSFSIVVSLLSNARPTGSSPDSILPITRLIQKRKSTSAALGQELALPGGDSDSTYCVLQPKPSILSMPSSKHYEKARRVRLLFAPDKSPLLEIRDDVKDKVLHSVDVSRVEARTVYAVDRAHFHLSNVLFLPVAQRAGGRNTPLGPTTPFAPTFPADLNLERATSLALNSRGPSPSRGAGSQPGSRRPSTASATLGSISQFGSGSSSSSSGEKDKGKDEHDLFLHFESAASLRSWLALLQSRAIPEIHQCPPASLPTPPLSPSEDVPHAPTGQQPSRPFRLRRELKVTVGEARSLVFSTSAASSASSSYADLRVPLTPAPPASAHPYAQFGHHAHGAAAAGTVQHDAPGVYVELLSGPQSIARTTLKRHSAAPTWDEAFLFPYFSVQPSSSAAGGETRATLRLVVWKEKSLGKHSVLGSVEVPLGGARPAEGYLDDTWWPILHESGRRVGDLRLKVAATEQVVFPLARYGDLAVLTREATVSENPALVAALWRKDLDQSLGAKTIMKVATVRGKIEDVVGEMVARENLSADTLFRSNTPFTKCMDAFLKEFLLQSFIPHALSRTIQRVLDEKLAIEILPPASLARHASSEQHDEGERPLTESQRREMERQRRELRRLVEGCWEDVYAARQKVPEHVRNALRKIFDTVPSEVKWRGVTTLFFLRLITPAIINPHAFGLTLAVPEGATRRTLLLLAKAMSALSYGGLSDKQPEMHLVMNAFAAERREQVVDFIAFVTRKDDDVPSLRGRETTGIDGYLSRGHDDETGDAVADLVRESLLVKPFYLDAAADLAVLASLIHRALAMIDEDNDGWPSPYPKLAALVAGIVRDEQDALEYLMLQRMPAGFFPHDILPKFMAAPSPTDEPSRPPTRSSRSHTVSEAPLGVLRDGLSRTRSGSTSTIGEDDAGSTYSHATLGRRQRALASSPHTGGRRPSLPIALLGTKSPNPVSVFGLKPPPQAARKWTEAASDSSGGDDDDDWERDERHFAGQRATFSAKVNQQLLTSSLSVDAIGSTAAAAAPFATSQDDTTAASGGTTGRRKWKRVWNLKL